ncbi:AraC family transcriptional regulator [Pseudomonas abietaniphila]|uniref:helix-turn-helix transcriptional regulator n=1 Tax=Pseudomonas abietaniphila TaxID=89065 RepID=UPI0032163DF1
MRIIHFTDVEVIRLVILSAEAPINCEHAAEYYSGAEAGDAEATKRTQENLAPWRVKRAKALMIELMAQGCSIEQVANECAISRSHFSRAFKNTTGLAPHDWLRQEKIRRAEALLKTGQIPISRVAQECGFSDQSYFTRVFRQLKGISPRRWQSQMGSLTSENPSAVTQ